MKYKVGDILYTDTGPEFAFEVVAVVSPTFDRKTPMRDFYTLQFINHHENIVSTWNVDCYGFDKNEAIYPLDKLSKVLR